MKHANISTCIDLLFCFVFLPLVITMAPVDKWIVNHTGFLLALIAYLYGLYFVYRKAKLPLLFMQRRFGYILLLMAILITITILLTHFPSPPVKHTHTIWFLFLVVTGFSLSVELVFELFRQIRSKQEIVAEKDKNKIELEEALRRIKERGTSSKSIVVMQKYDKTTIPLSDILYIEAMENYTKIYRIDGGHILSHTNLKSIQEMLPDDSFLRIHRSYIISLEKVETFSKKKIILSGEEKSLPIGRQYADRTYKWLVINRKGAPSF